jgi:hypothetical protein
MRDVEEAYEDLQDARSELQRYRGLVHGLAGGFALGLGGFITGASLVGSLGDGTVAAITTSFGILALACLVGFIVRVVTGHETVSDYRVTKKISQHSEAKVRRALRAYNRALSAEAA